MTLPEAGRIVADSMKGTPALLAVIVLQVATLWVVYSVASANSERAHERQLALIAACGPKEP